MATIYSYSGGGSEDSYLDAPNMVHLRLIFSRNVPDSYHIRAAGERDEHQDRVLLRAGGLPELCRAHLHDDLGGVPGQHRHPDCQEVHRQPCGLTLLQRMGVGRFLAIPALAAAALVESWRLRSVRARQNLSIGWQLPQFVILACSDVFCGIAQLEFFYAEAPASVRSLCSAFQFLAMSQLAYYLNTLVVSVVAAATRSGGGPSWLPADLNDGHLDYYFWLWTWISVVNYVVYTAFAKRYTVKKVVRQ